MSNQGTPSRGGEGLTDARKLLTEEEREMLLSRVHSLVYWVGMLIPEHELLGGSEIDLREVVYNLTSKDHLTSEEVAQINELIRLIKDKERVLEKRLAHDPMTLDSAKAMVEETCGLLRAIEELRTVETSEKAEFRKADVISRLDDARRWQRFVESTKMAP
ncbi:MAG: hypothetical protein A3K76_00735 [Euryarchaeota archaeon RBG_13_57_23]|nr:MAG: hypothetical protein A3K76_00735 [Euryarchaeota archaeon RBG_13_57_23]